MKTRLSLIAASALALSAFVVAPATAQDSMYSDWDADQSGAVDRGEFDKGLNGLKIYDAWEKDPDAQMSEGDFDRDYGEADWRDDQTFSEWDADRDAGLDRSEFQTGYYEQYDANDDDMLDEEEFGLFEQDADERGWFD